MAQKPEQKKDSESHKNECSDVVLIGTTTLQRMLLAVYDEKDALHSRNTYSECGGARMRAEENPRLGDEAVYLYYHKAKDMTIMTTIEGDHFGFADSSAGFEGKVETNSDSTGKDVKG